MNPSMAIFRRELAARRELPLMALAVAIMIGLLPFLPNIETSEAADVRTVGSGVSAMALGWVLALLLGSTAFGSDLSAGRFGFFLARPVSGFAVWWGKVMAAMALVWIVEIIVLMPGLYSEGIGIFTSFAGVDWLTIPGYVVAPLLLFLIAHAVSIMARARTAWLLLDVVGVAALVVGFWLVTDSLFFGGAFNAFVAVAGGLLAFLVVALLVAGGVGVTVGRTDLHRTHAACSLTLWVGVAFGLLAAFLFTRWLWDFGVEDLRRVEVLSVAPDGRWVDVSGYGAGRLDVRGRFFVSTLDGRPVPFPEGADGFFFEAMYSMDGSTALWIEHDLRDEERRLWWADLTARDPEIVSSALSLSAAATVTLSVDGKGFAVLDDGILSVYAFEGDRQLTAIRLPPDLHHATVFFHQPDRIRLIAHPEPRTHLEIAEIDVDTGTVTRTGRIAGVDSRPIAVFDSELRNMVVWTMREMGQSPERKLYDARTGILIREVDMGGFPRFLRDGRLICLEEGAAGKARLVIESVVGSDRVVHEFERHPFMRFIGEVESGVVALASLADPADRLQGQRIYLVDLVTGATRSIDAGLRRGFGWTPIQPGHAGTFIWFGRTFEAFRIFEDQSGAIQRWEPDTGRLIHVVGGES